MARQLALLDTPPDWKIDERTRELGLAGIARARAALVAASRGAAAGATDQQRSAA